jgi:hypothetical protein
MHPLFAEADALSGDVIGAAVELHRIMGPGLLESIFMSTSSSTGSQRLSCPVRTSFEQKETTVTKFESRA